MIAVDANILLELLESRSRAQQVIEALSGLSGQGNFAISTLTLSHLFYLAESHKLPLARAEKLVSPYLVYPVTAKDADWALANYRGKDFEDALQIAAARREKCHTFVTLDAGLAKKYRHLLNIRLVS